MQCSGQCVKHLLALTKWHAAWLSAAAAAITRCWDAVLWEAEKVSDGYACGACELMVTITISLDWGGIRREGQFQLFDENLWFNYWVKESRESFQMQDTHTEMNEWVLEWEGEGEVCRFYMVWFVNRFIFFMPGWNKNIYYINNLNKSGSSKKWQPYHKIYPLSLFSFRRFFIAIVQIRHHKLIKM